MRNRNKKRSPNGNSEKRLKTRRPKVNSTEQKLLYVSWGNLQAWVIQGLESIPGTVERGHEVTNLKFDWRHCGGYLNPQKVIPVTVTISKIHRNDVEVVTYD